MSEGLRVDNSNFVIATDRELFVLRWKEASKSSIDEWIELLDAHCDRSPRATIAVSILGGDTVPASQELRSQIMASVEPLYPKLGMVRIALLGRGLRLSMIRSGLVIMTLVAARSGQPFEVDATAEALAAAVAGAMGCEPRATIDWLVAAGLVRGDEIGASPPNPKTLSG